jgi:hypothetical protein
VGRGEAGDIAVGLACGRNCSTIVLLLPYGIGFAPVTQPGCPTQRLARW